MGGPDELDVSETGSYTELGEGPMTDTEAFASSSQGVPDAELDSPTLDKPPDSFSTGEWPTIPLNANRASNVTEPEATSGRLLLMVGIGLIVIMVLGALFGVAVGLAAGDSQSVPAPAESEEPDQVGNEGERIPVRKGVQ